jgi:phosphatidylinositol-binding clathrin assembly protein
MTGMAAFSQPQIQPQPTIYAPMQIQIQTTGFPMAQASAMSPTSPQQQFQLRQRSASNPFGGSSSQPNAFLQAQPTGYLQTQMTGANPFRQSMAFPQATGFAPVASMPTGFVPPTGFNPFQTPTPSQGSGSSSPFGQPSPFLSQTAGNPSSFPAPFALPSGTAPAATATSAPFSQHPSNVPPRPASTPLTNTNPLRQTLTPVKSHQTGSRNPFGAPVAEVPPVPKPPTLMELAMMTKGGFGAGAGGAYANGNGDAPQPQREAQSAGALNSASGQAVSDMGGVASSFLFSKSTAGSAPTGIPSFLSSQNTSTTMTSDSTATTADMLFSPLSSNPTGATTSTAITSGTFGSPAPSVSILKPQPTGFGGIKPFKPSSSFGASLMESLPPIPQSSSSTPTTSPTSPTLTAPKPNFMLSQPQAFPSSAASGTGTAGAAPAMTVPTLQPTGFGAFSQSVGASAFGGQGQIQPKGTTSTLGVGLRPQMTGGTANPFRASMFASPDVGMASAFIASGPPVGAGAGVGTPFATTAWPQQNGGSLI